MLVRFEFALDQYIVQVGLVLQVVDGGDEVGQPHALVPLIRPGTLHMAGEHHHVLHLFQDGIDVEYVAVLHRLGQGRRLGDVHVQHGAVAPVVDAFQLRALRIGGGQQAPGEGQGFAQGLFIFEFVDGGSPYLARDAHRVADGRHEDYVTRLQAGVAAGVAAQQ